MGTDPIREIARAAARVKAARNKQPKRVRLHPLDWQLLERRYGVKKTGIMSPPLVMGIPVELDCAVRRGEPVADYE